MPAAVRRKRTASITLVLIGSAALAGCAEDDPSVRDVYRTKADCHADWGSDPARCEPVRSGPHAGYYYGPTYMGSTSRTGALASLPRSGSNAISTAEVARGGLGATASSHSSSS